jgi:hypothetical protein
VLSCGKQPKQRDTRIQAIPKEVPVMKLWDRIHRGMEAGFDSALAAVHAITEKAGESIELTYLRREKARCETQLTRILAEVGNTVYEKVSESRLDDVSEQLGIKDLIIELAENEARIVAIDTKLRKALKAQDTSRAAGGQGKAG